MRKGGGAAGNHKGRQLTGRRRRRRRRRRRLCEQHWGGARVQGEIDRGCLCNCCRHTGPQLGEAATERNNPPPPWHHREKGALAQYGGRAKRDQAAACVSSINRTHLQISQSGKRRQPAHISPHLGVNRMPESGRSGKHAERDLMCRGGEIGRKVRV